MKNTKKTLDYSPSSSQFHPHYRNPQTTPPMNFSMINKFTYSHKHHDHFSFQNGSQHKKQQTRSTIHA